MAGHPGWFYDGLRRLPVNHVSALLFMYSHDLVLYIFQSPRYLCPNTSLFILSFMLVFHVHHDFNIAARRYSRSYVHRGVHILRFVLSFFYTQRS